MVLNSMVKKSLLSGARSQIKKFIKKKVLAKLPDDRVAFTEKRGEMSIQTTTEFADDLITGTGKQIGNMGRDQILMIGIMPSDIANIIRQEFKEYEAKHNKKGGK